MYMYILSVNIDNIVLIALHLFTVHGPSISIVPITSCFAQFDKLIQMEMKVKGKGALT